MNLYRVMSNNMGKGVYYGSFYCYPYQGKGHTKPVQDSMSSDFASTKFIDLNNILPKHPASRLFFSPRAFAILEDLFPREYHDIVEVHYREFLIGYVFEPARIHYSIEYPLYAQIDAERPENVHYFQKFPDVNFALCTQTLWERVKEHKLRGFKMVPRWPEKKKR